MNTNKQDEDRATGADHRTPTVPNSYNPVDVQPGMTLVMFLAVLAVGAIACGVVYCAMRLLGVQS